jgi:hypothetical protein
MFVKGCPKLLAKRHTVHEHMSTITAQIYASILGGRIAIQLVKSEMHIKIKVSLTDTSGCNMLIKDGVECVVILQ